MVGRHAISITDRPEARFPEIDEVLGHYAADNPLILHYERTRDGHALKISDFISQRELHHRELYQSLYRRLEVEYQMAFTLPARPPLVIGIALNRGLRDFSDRDRLVLDLVRPHLAQRYRGAALLSEMERAAEDAGRSMVLVNGRGCIQMATDRARRWLTVYFGERMDRLDRLPSQVLLWLRRQQGRLNSFGEVPPLADALMAEREGRRLTVQLAPRLSLEGEDLLILEERALELTEQDISSLGLTRREAEVLRWAAYGKTDAEIASLLVTSPRTVQKHLEHIYLKLGVRTRTAAAAKAFSVAGMQPSELAA